MAIRVSINNINIQKPGVYGPPRSVAVFWQLFGLLVKLKVMQG